MLRSSRSLGTRRRATTLALRSTGDMPQPAQGVHHLLGRDVDAQDLFQLRQAQREGLGVVAGAARLDQAGQQFAAGQFEDELGGPQAGTRRAAWGRCRARSGRSCRCASPGRRAVLRTESGSKRADSSRMLRRPLGDFAVLAAHDAGERDRPGGVGDHQHVRRQLGLLAVDGHQLLAGPGPADDDPPAFEPVEVERVQRLARLEHDVVGDVHDVVDRPQPDRLQAALHPVGAGADLHAADDAGRVVRAEVGGFDRDRDGGRRGVGDFTRGRGRRRRRRGTAGPASADNSRATPTWERQSLRLLVTSTSITASSPCASMVSTGRPPRVSASAAASASVGPGRKSPSHSRLIFMGGQTMRHVPAVNE